MKYAVDANLFRLGSTNPKKFPPHGCFFFSRIKLDPSKNDTAIIFGKEIKLDTSSSGDDDNCP